MPLSPAPSPDVLISPEDCLWHSYRLPTSILPWAYRLNLEVILVEGYNATGYLEIDIVAAKPTQCIVLHAVGIIIDSATVLLDDGSEMEGNLSHYALGCVLICGSFAQKPECLGCRWL